ncbi:bacteriocin fulvocin C-related protein [Nocardiopsis sp. MG754419]|uniref:bacteriocin fulvocin C-related protein n=1 Tax=Nocardiopsis sp. MG754419 TaxID=2259865 RepID=UPI001BA8BEF9|nr:bacteriocin fulvocin C-related protein [Nocardiopsis sp. MG754419]MBR8744202.1 hypothetical protein [Nocardiopsis sp. MG754419]
MSNVRVRYVLAFDSSCERCASISAAVATASAGRLETLPLTHREVRDWRAREWGPTAPWVPTLIRAHGRRVRCWRGAAMIAPLVNGLGASAALRVVEVLGELGHDRHVTRRGRHRWRRLMAGARAVLELTLARRTPDLARSDQALAREWVEAHRARLPTDYDEFAAHPLVRRRLIFAELSPERRRDLWAEQLGRFDRANPGLTWNQRAVLDLARVTLSEERVFRDGLRSPVEQRLRYRAVAAFGPDRAHALLATLGPVEADPECAADRPLIPLPRDSWEPCLSKGCVEVPFTCGVAWVSTHDRRASRAATRVYL